MARRVAVRRAPINKNHITLAIIAFATLMILFAAAMFYWQQTAYLTAPRARVAAPLYSVTPPVTDKLVKFTANAGDKVAADEVIGRLEKGLYLKSPVKGKIIETHATLNETVTPAKPVAVIADTKELHIAAEFDAKHKEKLRQDQPAEVTLSALGDKKYKGAISAVEDMPEGGVLVKIKLTQAADLADNIGSAAKVTVQTR